MFNIRNMKTNYLGIRLEPETLAALDEVAKKERRSRSDTLRILIEDAIAERNRPLSIQGRELADAMRSANVEVR